jgi:hypothetical protein
MCRWSSTYCILCRVQLRVEMMKFGFRKGAGMVRRIFLCLDKKYDNMVYIQGCSYINKFVTES